LPPQGPQTRWSEHVTTDKTFADIEVILNAKIPHPTNPGESIPDPYPNVHAVLLAQFISLELAECLEAALQQHLSKHKVIFSLQDIIQTRTIGLTVHLSF
jgi:hypothetical protein